MGTDKRERQKTARLEKIVAEQAAAKRARTRRTALRAVAAAVVLLGGLFAITTIWGDDDDSDAETTDDTSTTFPEMSTTTTTYSNPALAEEVLARTAPDPAPPPADTPADALEISTLIEGQGDGAVAGDNLAVHYVGKMPDGMVFDESWSGGQTLPVQNLGQAQLISGWNEGLIGAKVGERRRLVLGANKAYGAQGNQGIPPNTPLVFEIDVVDIQKAGG